MSKPTMRLIGGDFETYWAPDYTLSKMTTESYVRDPRFEPIMLSLGTSQADMVTAYGHDNIAYLLKQYDWRNTMFIAHNNMFDGFILGERFGVYPKAYGCTESMSRALGLHAFGGASLDKLTALARRCGVDLPEKGHQVESYKGFHLADFSPAQLADYTGYCQKDTISTYGLFQWFMRLGFPMAEVRAVDEFIRLMAEPRLALDGNLLARRIAAFAERRINMLERLGVSLQQIRSDAMFADLLRQYDVDPPMKPSPKRRNPDGSPLMVYAFSKTDEEFTELQEHDDPDVQLLIMARLKLKSTIEESRMTRLLGIAERGLLPVPLKYYGAHTGRPAATGKINMTNFTRPVNPRHHDEGMLVKLPGDRFEHIVAINNRDNDKPATKFMVKSDSAFWPVKKHYLAGLRDCIVAPPGHVIGVSDLNAIEARGLAWLAQQLDVLANFKESDELPPDLPDSEVRDVYTRFGDVLYGRTITKADKRERQMSKVCVLGLGYLMGPSKLVRAAKVQGGMDIDLDFAKTAVNVYRTKNDRIKAFWKDCKTALACMANGEEYSFGPNGLYTAVPARGKGPATIVMPNGLNLIYTGLGTQPGKYGDDYFYYTPKGRNLVKTKIHPGQVAENLCQALARIIINDQWLRIKNAAVREKLVPRSPVVGHVYDEIICCVPTEHGQRIKEIMLHEMTIGPSWAKGLPLKAEADLAQRYGDAK